MYFLIFTIVTIMFFLYYYVFLTLICCFLAERRRAVWTVGVERTTSPSKNLRSDVHIFKHSSTSDVCSSNSQNWMVNQEVQLACLDTLRNRFYRSLIRFINLWCISAMMRNLLPSISPYDNYCINEIMVFSRRPVRSCLQCGRGGLHLVRPCSQPEFPFPSLQ